MHRLPFVAPLVGVLVVCSSLLGGCGREKKHDSPAASQPAQVEVSSKPTVRAATPATQPDANQEAAGDTRAQTGTDASEPQASNASDDTLAEYADAKSPVDDAPSTAVDSDTSPAPEPTWSTQRLVLLAPGGPRVIDLRMNVQGKDLATGFAEATEALAEELEIDFDAPISWEALLDKPLVKSGWFGNLVPSPEQRAELLALYDRDNSGTVDLGEFQAFVTRGLSRRDPVRVAQARTAAAPLAGANSPWGPLDQDEDGQLSQEELNQTGDALMHFDFDGDRIVTEGELRSTTEATSGAMNMSRSSSLLDLSLVLTPDAKQPTALERAVHEHYTFAETIGRDAFFGWDADRWNELDQDAKGEIAKRDLAPLHDMPADAQIDVALPNSLSPRDSEREVNDASVALSGKRAKDQTTWSAGPTSGRLSLPGCVVLVRVRDDHSQYVRRILSQQFARAVDDAQRAAALTGSLELRDGAWDLLRGLGPEGAAQAWRWIATPRHFRVAANWRVIEKPWFELVDANADERLTALELSEFHASAGRWDRNLNGTLEEDEVPLVVSLTIAREDNRLANFSTGGMNMEKGGGNDPQGPSWFAGMDYNLDGEVTHAEFLGEDTEFEALDANGDGIIDIREVYAPH